MRRIRYHAGAREEFLREVRYYTRINPRPGERFDKSVQAAEAHAAEAPDTGSPCLHGTRRVYTKRFPFSNVYVASDTEVFVIAVAPFRKRPGYWRRRK